MWSDNFPPVILNGKTSHDKTFPQGVADCRNSLAITVTVKCMYMMSFLRYILLLLSISMIDR